MSKRGFKSQASSSRVATSAYGGSSFGSASFGTGFGATPSSTLSYVYEPPDISLISDSSIQKAFKTLQKKDSTTKAKALEDLQTHVAHILGEGGGLEDPILEAWVALYPRTSIDNSRRVRQLAHAFQGQVAAACGKRIVKYIPNIVGAWLCGLQDNDKTVSKGVEESFSKVFTSPEKRHGVWQKFQGAVLIHCRDAVLKETVQTLSDERVTSPDDAEAKYARVVATSLLTVRHAIVSLSEDEVRQESEKYSELLQSKEVLKFASYRDSFVRRALFRLLTASVLKIGDLIDYSLVGSYILQEALASSQSGSANEFVKMCLQLTTSQPAVWTTYYKGTGKKSASRRLASFFRKGSQAAPTEFWQTLSTLIHDLPIMALLDEEDPLVSLVALREGVSRKEELRPSHDVAWKAYLQLSARLLSSGKLGEESVNEICKEHVMPLVINYVRPSDATVWKVSGHNIDIYVLAVMVCQRADPRSVEETLERISSIFVQDLQSSLPEQSQEFEKNQEWVVAQAQRWYSILVGLKEKALISKIVSKEIVASISTLNNRNGKPYCAAATIDLAIRAFPDIVKESEGVLSSFARQDIPKLMATPSSPYLLRILESLGSIDGMDDVYHTCLKSLIEAPPTSSRSRALATLISSHWPQDQAAAATLSAATITGLGDALNGTENWPLAVLKNQSVPSSLTDELLTSITENLSIEDNTENAVDALETVSKHNNKAIRNFVSSSNGTALLSKLIFLSQIDDEELKDRAIRLKDSINRATNGAVTVNGSMIDIVRNGVLDVSSTALPVESLVEQAKMIVEDRPDAASKLLPDLQHCFSSLEPFLTEVDDSLAITNPLGGAVYFVESSTYEGTIRYDADGYSAACRLALYLSEILYSVKGSNLSHFLAIYLEVATDRRDLLSRHQVWRHEDMSAHINRITTFLEAENCATELLIEAEGENAWAYYNARAYARMIRSSNTLVQDDERLAKMRRAENILSDTAFLTSVETSRASLKLCNELLSDLAAKPLGESEQACRKLVLLNRLMESYGGNLEDIPQQRLVFFVKHIVSSFPVEGHLRAEVPKALRFILPMIKDLYGDFWEEILVFTISLTTGDIPAVYNSLGLYSTLLDLREDSNEDLVDALLARKEEFDDALFELLSRSCERPDTSPQRMVNELLGQLLPSSTGKSIDLYKPFGSGSPSLQKAAFNVLHSSIPAAQEQRSIDAAIDGSTARIEEDLLSLVSLRPAIDYMSFKKHSERPVLMRYLLGWKLVFDHWNNASYKVQSDYVDQVKESGALDGLLTFVAELLIHRGGSKSTFKPENVERFLTPEELMVHIYYLSMLHLPYLAKAWWRSCPRSLERQVEEWTERYISPAVISAELATLSKWDPNPEGTEMEVKSSIKEVTASYPIDEQMMAIRVTLPSSYPLNPISVTTINRVGIDEKKWSAWLNTSNIAINFSSSSQGLGCVIDGLVAWRKNVVGKLKGQSECAICYSVVSGDRQLPTKKCGTCKNMFHGSCLFKWFRSSSSSSCPLCRNAFNYEDRKH